MRGFAHIVLCAHVGLFLLFAETAPSKRRAAMFHLDIPDRYADYLRAYGYADKAPLQLLPYKTGDTAEAAGARERRRISIAISKLQEYAHLDVTGTLDEATERLMNAPRCGLPDNEYPISTRRLAKRSVRKWSNGDIIKWRWDVRRSRDFYRLSSRFAPYVNAEFQTAFDTWANGTALKFSRSRQADIVLSFGRRGHDGCSYEFDGPGGVLAHAFYPGESDDTGGDVHFDSDETWYAGNRRQREYDREEDDWETTSLFHVAVHEIGHAIGLSHNRDRSSVMFPWYSTESINALSPKLPAVDSASVRRLYADLYDEGPESEDVSAEDNREEIPVSHCDWHGPYDDITYFEEEVFMVKNGALWRWYFGRPVEKGTNRLVDHFIGLPRFGRINAFHYDGLHRSVIVVTGDDLYVYALTSGGPSLRRRMSVRLDVGLSYYGPIDTIFEWRAETVAFAGPYYWSLDPQSMKARYSGYIEDKWPVGPSDRRGYHAAFSHNGRSYFVLNDTYWEYDTESGEFLRSGNTVGGILPGCDDENRLFRSKATAVATTIASLAPLIVILID